MSGNLDAEAEYWYLLRRLADVDHDPRKVARDERKARVAKNEKQRLGNAARAAGPREVRKQEIERTLATSRISTASMGKFDKKLEGEKKVRGVKRKVRCVAKFIFYGF
jgi:regulator of ribosome biosynthesis